MDPVPKARPSVPTLTVETSVDAGAFVIRVSGSIDIATAGELKGAAAAALQSGQPLVILDLDACDFIDSTGLGEVVGLCQATGNAGQELRITPGGRAVRRVFQVSGLSDLPFTDR